MNAHRGPPQPKKEKVERRMTRINADFPVDLVRISSARIRVIRGSFPFLKGDFSHPVTFMIDGVKK